MAEVLEGAEAPPAAETETKPNIDALADSVTYVLRFPIGKDADRLTQVKMRRPKVRDRLLMAQSASTDTEMEALLIGNLCGVAPDQMQDMDMLDYRALQAKLESFTNPLLLTT